MMLKIIVQCDNNGFVLDVVRGNSLGFNHSRNVFRFSVLPSVVVHIGKGADCVNANWC